MKLFTNSNLIKFGWEKTKDNVAEIVTAILFIIFLAAAKGFLNEILKHSDNPYHAMLSGFTQFAIAIIAIVFSMNLIKEGLVVVRGGKGNVKNFLKYPENFWPYVGGQIVAGILTFIGFILLIIPGIIASLMFFFVKPLLVDVKIGPIQSIKKSYGMTKGHLWDLFLFVLGFLLLNIAGALMLVIGLFFTLPITFFAFLRLYDIFLNLKAQQSQV